GSPDRGRAPFRDTRHQGGRARSPRDNCRGTARLMKVSMNIEGLRELEIALEQVEKRATRTAVARRALKKAGEPIAEAMRAGAPVAEGVLRDEIIVSTKLGSDAGKQAFHRAMKAGLGKAA